MDFLIGIELLIYLVGLVIFIVQVVKRCQEKREEKDFMDKVKDY